MTNIEVRIVFEPRWWLPLYVWGVALTCQLTGSEPNLEQFHRWAIRGHRAYLLIGDERLRLQ